ncbi:hypothetical protein AB0J57_05050 [Streptomyces sp. NPDC049837]|uniref:hypothetical protein n=1 Tax=Streptomyces sp. NPDC049837 TaxID=3155277 RepID=UPI00341BB93A
MSHEPSSYDLLNIADAIKRVDADALIEDAFADPDPCDEQIAVQMHLASTSGDPVKARTAQMLFNSYRLHLKAGD